MEVEVRSDSEKIALVERLMDQAIADSFDRLDAQIETVQADQPYTLVNRQSGLVEVVCSHGVGHPSKRCTPDDVWLDWMSTHGCDGCCETPEWRQAEDDAWAMQRVQG